MAGYTKEQYDQLYRFRVCRYFGGRSPNESPVYLHYHKYAMQPILQTRWSVLAPVLAISPTELCLIVGAGFGWGVESFIAETGCTTVGVDVSAYIHAELDNSEETEIRAAIVAAGFNPDTGKGQTILNGTCDFQPRRPTNVIVLNEDMQTNQSRGNIRAALGGWPTVCIVEDIVDSTTTDQEITQVQNALTLFSGDQRTIWIYNGTASRSLQDLQTLTGAEVISPDGARYLVP